MSGPLGRFERIARVAGANHAAVAVEVPLPEQDEAHPFDTRNIHSDLPKRVRQLFDDAHWEQSVFEAFKFVEKEVKRLSGQKGKTGHGLMMEVFNPDKPLIRLNGLSTDSEIDEQLGYRFLFAGAASGIRNPRGHEIDLGDTPDEALDYLAFASLLLRRLDAAGLRS